jgi:hypothetical protein
MFGVWAAAAMRNNVSHFHFCDCFIIWGSALDLTMGVVGITSLSCFQTLV